MARPIPVIAAVSDVLTLPGSMALDGSGSLDSLGAPGNIASYQWTLVEKPPGSAASLTAPTTATPTLTNIDIVGNYVVFLIVVDNLGASSFGYAYPRQHLPPEDLTTYDVPLYAFESPVAGAFVVVKAPYNNVAARLNQPIYKTGRKEFGWLVDSWNQADTVEDLREEMLELYDRPNLAVLADAVRPQTGGAGVAVDGLNIKDTGAITAIDSNRATIRVLDNFSVAANKNLQLEAGSGSLRTDNIQSTTGGDITSTSGMVIPEVITPLITGDAGLAITATANSSVVVTGAFAIDASGTVTLESNSADLLIYGDTEVRIGSPGAFNVYTNSGVSLSAGPGAIILDTADAIYLQPTAWTESSKPVFAAGLAQAETRVYTTPAPTGSPITLAAFTLTRHNVGCSVDVDGTFNYIIGAGAQECDLALVLSSATLGVQSLALVEVGVGPKAVGRVSIRAQLTIPAAATLHCVLSYAEKIGAGVPSVDTELYSLSPFDVTETLNISLVLTPRPANTWGAGSSLAGVLRTSLIAAHAEAVL